MSEHGVQLIASLKIAWIAVFSYLYGEGGISGKWKRRLVGAVWMMLGIWVFSIWQKTWHNWYLLSLPIIIGGLFNGYGGVTKTWDKVRRRSIYGVLLGLTGLPLVAFSGLWVLFGFSVCLAVVSSVLLGAWNPTKSARDEETLIASLTFIFTLFLI